MRCVAALFARTLITRRLFCARVHRLRWNTAECLNYDFKDACVRRMSTFRILFVEYTVEFRILIHSNTPYICSIEVGMRVRLCLVRNIYGTRHYTTYLYNIQTIIYINIHIDVRKLHIFVRAALCTQSATRWSLTYTALWCWLVVLVLVVLLPFRSQSRVSHSARTVGTRLIGTLRRSEQRSQRASTRA